MPKKLLLPVLWLLVIGGHPGAALARPAPASQPSWDRGLGTRLESPLRRSERRRYRWGPIKDVRPLSPRDLAKALAPFEQSDRATVSTFGQVGDYPLVRIDLPARPKGVTKNRPRRRPLRVLIDAGLHGDETAGPQVALKLARRALKDKGFAERFELTVLPLSNVPGARTDPAGYDLNREFTRRSTSSVARTVKRAINPHDYDLFVDLHGAYRPGFFLIRGKDDGDISRRILGAMERAALLDAPPSSPQLNAYNMHCLGGCSTATKGTFKGYLAKTTPFSYTLEAPRGLSPEQQIRGMYKLLLSTLHHVYREGKLD